MGSSDGNSNQIACACACFAGCALLQFPAAGHSVARWCYKEMGRGSSYSMAGYFTNSFVSLIRGSEHNICGYLLCTRRVADGTGHCDNEQAAGPAGLEALV